MKMYTIKALADLSDVSSRTLRYYDEIGLLHPSAYTDAGYRLYNTHSVELLQQILFYKYLGMQLGEIKEIIYQKDFDIKYALQSHKENLQIEMQRIQALMHTIDRTIDDMNGGNKMSPADKFEGFKKDLIKQNDLQYGKELRERYGESYDLANEKLLNESEEKYQAIESLTDEMQTCFKIAFNDGNPESEKAQTACAMHEKWLKFYWKTYDKKSHMALVESYVSDERFRAYYDKIALNLSFFIRDAMKVYLDAL